MKVGLASILVFVAGCSVIFGQDIIKVNGLKGKIIYKKEAYRGHPIWIRPDPNQLYAKHPDSWKRRLEPENEHSDAVAEIMREIRPGHKLGKLTSDREIWNQFRNTWDWSIRNMRQDIKELKKLKTVGQSRSTLHEHAVAKKKLGYLPTGTCGSVSNLFIQLLIRGGVPSDRVAMAQATYPRASSSSGTASHAYVILFVNGKWHYLDPNARMTNRKLPTSVSDMRSLGYPKGKGVEYQWPFDTSFYQPHPLDGKLPLVSD